jgi:hypothetical protein
VRARVRRDGVGCCAARVDWVMLLRAPRRHTEVVELLILAGADVDYADTVRGRKYKYKIVHVDACRAQTLLY